MGAVMRGSTVPGLLRWACRLFFPVSLSWRGGSFSPAPAHEMQNRNAAEAEARFWSMRVETRLAAHAFLKLKLIKGGF